MGTSKVYILDKYFNELQKFWDTEKRLQGNSHTLLKQPFCKERKSDQLKVVISLFTLQCIGGCKGHCVLLDDGANDDVDLLPSVFNHRTIWKVLADRTIWKVLADVSFKQYKWVLKDWRNIHI